MVKTASRGYVWDPAGSDRDLAAACLDAALGRLDAVRRVLEESRGHFWLRAARSLVLATTVADGDVAEQCLTLAPHDPDALLLYARTMVVRALRLGSRGDGRAAREMSKLAADACHAAARVYEADPTPWIAMLSLSALGLDQTPDPYGLRVSGPWALWQEIYRRDRFSREGHRRLLAAVSKHHGGSHAAMWAVARWAQSESPANSDPQLLILVAYAEHYRARREDPMVERQWSDEGAMLFTERLRQHWFGRVAHLRAPLVPVADLSLLAHALLASGDKQLFEAAKVMEAMLPYAARYPWDLDGDPVEQLDKALWRLQIQPP